MATPPPGSPQLSAQTEALSLDTEEISAQLEPVDGPSSGDRALPNVRELDENLDTAFQLATNRGPLCAEPVVGMAYFLESIELNVQDLEPAQGE